ncbi:hypothetical protein cyc_05477 [Cyclospora cayetanensis]|nr:hypothetical protein cyc_05477 [Cyclospora cayetanensis]
MLQDNEGLTAVPVANVEAVELQREQQVQAQHADQVPQHETLSPQQRETLQSLQQLLGEAAAPPLDPVEVSPISEDQDEPQGE